MIRAARISGPEEAAHADHGSVSAAWPPCSSIAPIFPTADLDAMQAHYEALGFAVQRARRRLRHGGPRRRAHPLPPRARTAAGARHGRRRLHRGRRRRRAARGVGAAGVGETSDLFDPGFGVWEAAHTDADGNLLRFGSPLARRP